QAQCEYIKQCSGVPGLWCGSILISIRGTTTILNNRFVLVFFVSVWLANRWLACLFCQLFHWFPLLGMRSVPLSFFLVRYLAHGFNVFYPIYLEHFVSGLVLSLHAAPFHCPKV